MIKEGEKLYAVLIILIFLFRYAIAVEYDPAQYITKQTYMLRENESIGNIKEIELDGKVYYVVQIIANKDVVGYIALERFEKRVVSGQVKSKRLFQTMHFLDQYLKFKKRVSDNPSYIWFVLQHEQIPIIEQALETEKYELALISQVVNTEEVIDKVANLVSMLDSINNSLEELRKEMLDAVSFESEFLNAPKAGQETELREKMLKCYEKLEEVFQKKKTYEALLVQLRIDIANNPELSIEEKKSLQKTSELPKEAHAIDSWYSSANNMHFKENIENAYQSAVQRSSKFAGDVATRIKRDSVYRFIYEENEKLEKETNNELITLKSAYDIIMDEKYYEKWLNREQLKEFKTNWAKAIASLEKEDYDNAMRHAQKALNNAIAVYKDGFFQQSSETDISNELFIALLIIAFVLIGMLTIRYIVKRKDKLFERSGEEYEEVEFKDI